MPKYIKHLNQMSNPKTFQRKVQYLSYNFGEIIKKVTKNNGYFLEIGPGLGELVFYVNSLGSGNIDVLDTDESILRHIKSCFKVRKIYRKGLHRIGKNFRYDCIFLIQVLEHLPLQEHIDTIKFLFSKLQKDGKLIFVVPNAGNPLGLVERYADLQHTTSFTEQSIRDLVESADLKGYNLLITGFQIPVIGLVNFTRRFLQKLLHLFVLATMIINGGTYFKLLTPNITFIITKTRLNA